MIRTVAIACALTFLVGACTERTDHETGFRSVSVSYKRDHQSYSFLRGHEVKGLRGQRKPDRTLWMGVSDSRKGLRDATVHELVAFAATNTEQSTTGRVCAAGTPIPMRLTTDGKPAYYGYPFMVIRRNGEARTGTTRSLHCGAWLMVEK